MSEPRSLLRRLGPWLLWALILSPGLLFIGPRVIAKVSGGMVVSIPSGSGMPTLIPGDIAIASSLSAEKVPPRGALAVFRHPFKEVDFIHRIIALPGETAQMSGGQIILNGAPGAQIPAPGWALERDGTGNGREPCKTSGEGREICTYERWIETLPNGVSYSVLNLGASVVDDTAPATVPEGHVFVLGDHRDNAVDSRFRSVGMIPIANLMARIDYVQMSFDGFAPRPDRFFKRVN